jgi:hypothetical protein
MRKDMHEHINRDQQGGFRISPARLRSVGRPSWAPLQHVFSRSIGQQRRLLPHHAAFRRQSGAGFRSHRVPFLGLG